MINKDLSIFCPSENRGVSVPFIDTCVQAGFPSPAEGFLSDPMNVHDLVVKNPAATFFVRVMGDSMQDAGIFSEDILVVDRSLDPREGKIVVAVVDGEFTVKKIHYEANGSITLLAANRAYAPIMISRESDFKVWGVVSYVIHKT